MAWDFFISQHPYLENDEQKDNVADCLILLWDKRCAFGMLLRSTRLEDRSLSCGLTFRIIQQCSSPPLKTMYDNVIHLGATELFTASNKTLAPLHLKSTPWKANTPMNFFSMLWASPIQGFCTKGGKLTNSLRLPPPSVFLRSQCFLVSAQVFVDLSHSELRAFESDAEFPNCWASFRKEKQADFPLWWIGIESLPVCQYVESHFKASNSQTSHALKSHQHPSIHQPLCHCQRLTSPETPETPKSPRPKTRPKQCPVLEARWARHGILLPAFHRNWRLNQWRTKREHTRTTTPLEPYSEGRILIALWEVPGFVAQILALLKGDWQWFTNSPWRIKGH